MTLAQNIATKFNVLESAIIRIEEWASVLFCVVKGMGARFVSKKLKATEEIKMAGNIEFVQGNESQPSLTND